MAVSYPSERILIRIEVHMDTLCPWCYVQKRSLDNAMKRFQERHPDIEFEVLYRPFYLYPLLDHGCDKSTLYEKNAEPNNFHTHIEKIRSAGARYGIQFHFTGTTGSSRNSHKLIALTLEQRDPATQARVVERLLSGHFEHGRDLTDTEWLVAVGEEAGGLAPKDVRRALESDEAGVGVDDEVRSATVERDVRAVPCVTMQGRYRVGGFQDEHVFVEQFQKIWANGGS